MSAGLGAEAAQPILKDMSDAPDWRTDGADWPNREASRFVRTENLTWHVQVMGEGPVILLLHGTGAATHSWRDLMPLLAEAFTVVAPDLPGHGFTGFPRGAMLSLPGMAAGVAELLRALDVTPVTVAGHSAGAAVAVRMVLDGLIAPVPVVALNGAFLPMGGAAMHLFSPLAKLMSQTSLTSKIFARRARDRTVVRRLLDGTGSKLDARGLDLYARLGCKPRHVAAAFAMMARWDLRRFAKDLPKFKGRLVLVYGTNDRSVPPSDSFRVSALCTGARLVPQTGFGHLAHEEDPATAARIIAETAREHLEETPNSVESGSC